MLQLSSAWSRSSRQPAPTWVRIVQVLLAFGLVAGAAIWTGENWLVPQTEHRFSAFGLAGEVLWGPDYHRCAQCGGMLIPRVDLLSACRHCAACDVSYRHQSLPQTLEEQDKVWKPAD